MFVLYTCTVKSMTVIMHPSIEFSVVSNTVKPVIICNPSGLTPDPSFDDVSVQMFYCRNLHPSPFDVVSV